MIHAGNVIAEAGAILTSSTQDIIDAEHAKGGKIFNQIWHAGRASHPYINNGASNFVASAIAIDGKAHALLCKAGYTVPRAPTEAEIAEIVQQFVTAAKNAISVAGFDGMEVRATNRFLIDQFLRDGFNQRTNRGLQGLLGQPDGNSVGCS
ncbi:hypothetical protein DYB28_009969 [Aphanomyces astaci]|uniref:NADH:flavin oxidoreductase/NADH oxidase N-terminal domain-containing protein n=1 Tax=Aphanomyces astaci TaxID=112090 RepID=A0A9X8H4T7_APHAT|nr:hypothetical protein DYB28_009969 [Aphanomyces astaci]